MKCPRGDEVVELECDFADQSPLYESALVIKQHLRPGELVRKPQKEEFALLHYQPSKQNEGADGDDRPDR
jgi:hypothetical protein